jgi:YVTN family beta-propeller protein
VANQSSGTVPVIDTESDYVIKTIRHVGTKPHGIAITADGNKVYVTQLLFERPGPGETRPRTQTEGADDGRVGRVTVIDSHTNSVITTVFLNPLATVGDALRSDGNTLAREPLSTPPAFDNVTGHNSTPGRMHLRRLSFRLFNFPLAVAPRTIQPGRLPATRASGFSSFGESRPEDIPLRRCWEYIEGPKTKWRT